MQIEKEHERQDKIREKKIQKLAEKERQYQEALLQDMQELPVEEQERIHKLFDDEFNKINSEISNYAKIKKDRWDAIRIFVQNEKLR